MNQLPIITIAGILMLLAGLLTVVISIYAPTSGWQSVQNAVNSMSSMGITIGGALLTVFGFLILTYGMRTEMGDQSPGMQKIP